MGRGAKGRRKRFKVDPAEVDKHAISIVATLCRELESGSASASASGAAAGQHRARVLRKFLEKDLAKTDRTMELFTHYLERVEACAAPDAPEDARGAAEYDEASEMGLYLLRRVDAGLLSLTRLAEVAVYAGAAHAQIRSRVHAKLRESRRGSDAIASVLDGAFASASASASDHAAGAAPTRLTLSSSCLSTSAAPRAHAAEFLASAPSEDDAQSFFTPAQRERLATVMRDVLATME